jgi:hypothetical protein
MKKQILEELSYMTYISNYKKGRVISEQVQTIGNQCQTSSDCNEDENCFNGYCVPKIITSSGTYGKCRANSDCGVGFMCKDGKCTVDMNSGYWDKTGDKPSATGSDPIYTGVGGSEFHTGWDDQEETPPKPNPKVTGSTETQKEHYINRLIKNILSEQVQTIGNQCTDKDDCPQNYNCFNRYCVPQTITSSGSYGSCKQTSDCGVGYKCENLKCVVDLKSGYWKKTGAKPSATGSDPIYTGPGGSEFHTGWNDREETPPKPTYNPIKK